MCMFSAVASWLFSLPATASAAWDFTGELPSWRSSFPDFDCRRRAAADHALDWDDLRRQSEEAPPEEWRFLVRPRLPHMQLEAALGSLREFLEPPCPLGTLFAAAVRYGDCLSGAPPRCPEAGLLSEIIQTSLRRTPLEVLLGTRWPLLSALDELRPAPFFGDPGLSCEGLERPRLDWPRLRRAFRPGADWFHEAKALVYHRGFQASWVGAMDECTYGFAMVSLWKLVVCAETQAECVSQYSAFVEDLLMTNDWREVVGNSWGPFGFLARVRHGIMRHEFHLDFLPGELHGRQLGVPAGPVFGPSPPLAGSVSASFAGVLESVLAGVPRTYAAAPADGAGLELRRLIYATMVFGPRYVPYIPRFVARAEALGIPNLVLFCLDAAAYDSCLSLPGGRAPRCIRGTPSILNKFTLPLAYLRLGVDVFWLDFDIFLMRDPTDRVLGLAHQKQADLLVSGSFADDCICSGLVYFRATGVVAEWLQTVLSWMYEHVYTHDQQAFSAFLAGRPDVDNVTTPERISSSKLFRLYLHPEVPRWAVLDPVTEFVSARVLNTTGWTGKLEDMYIFHVLHGDSEVNRDHSAYGWNTMHGFTGGGSQALLDILYNQSDDAIYYEAGPPHERSAAIREALLASRRPERPGTMLHCGVLQLNPYMPGRMSAEG